MEKSVDRHLIREYLLGRLNDSARRSEQDMVEAYLEDDDLYDELLDVEDQLLYQYLRDELSPDESDAFKGYLDRHPEGSEKLTFARALIKLAENDPAGKSTDRIIHRANESASIGQKSPWLLRGLGLIWQYGLVAGLIVAIGVVSYFYVGRLRSENQRLRSEIAFRNSEYEEQRRKFEKLEAELYTRQSDAERMAAEIARTQIQIQDQNRLLKKFQQTTPTLISWSLAPTTLRVPGSIKQQEKLTDGVSVILINAQVEEAGRYAGFEAVLQNVDGDLIWRQQVSHPLTIGHQLSLQLPANLFTNSDYILTLELIKADKSRIPASYYYFTVR